MSRRIDLNTKLRLTPKDAAYAVSIREDKIHQLIEARYLTKRGGKILLSELEELLSLVYHPTFPRNVKNENKKRELIMAFCSKSEILEYKLLGM